jgi:hypothetical protein
MKHPLPLVVPDWWEGSHMTCSAAPRSTQAFLHSIRTQEASRKIASRISSRSGSFTAILFAGTLALAFAPQPAQAQHGGGHSGGGGGHVSSSSSSSPASSSHVSSTSHVTYSKPAAAPAAAKPAAPRSGVSGGSSSTNAAPPASLHFGIASSSALAVPAGNSRRSAIPRNVTIGFPPRSGAESAGFRPALAPGSHLAFTGEGNEMWAEPSATKTAHAISAPLPQRTMAKTSATMASLKSSAPDFHAQNLKVESKLPRRPVIANPMLPLQPVFPGGGFFPGFGLFGFGDSFFGFGYGSGLGISPGCDPSMDSGCGRDVGGYGYYTNDDFDASASPATTDSDSAPDAQAAVQPPDQDVVNIWQDPPTPPASKPDEFAAMKSLVVLYLHDGSSYAVKNCWVAGGRLHYEASYGGENSLDLSALDLQRTVNANAARGVDFTLRPAPQAPPSQPAPESAPQQN